MSDAKLIELDASTWASPADFYDAVYDSLSDPSAMPLPHQFGYSIDALIDVVVVGRMAWLEPPYSICVHSLAQAPEAVQEEVRLAVSMVTEFPGRQDVSLSLA